MSAVKPNQEKTIKNNLFRGYSWFSMNIFQNIQKSTDEFFQKDFSLRFMGISKEENILFYGDEYFVNKIPVSKMSDIKVRISSEAVSALLDNALGVSERPFNLKTLTDIEAMLIKSFTMFMYKNISELLNKTEINKKVIENSKDYELTFYLQANSKHSGKIIISIPEYMIPNVEIEKIKENFSIVDFRKVKVDMKISAGSSKITLNEIKAIEEGDIILLENSNINEMSVVWKGECIPFRINPNPSLIISIENNGGNHMEEETSSKSQNMWDSILVDIVAEFDNVKLTLGELKQISEGLVIDVGSVYDSKIKLRVENQVVATGELVILNDRYGVKIDKVVKNKETKKAQPTPAQPMGNANAQEAKEGDENFDYSDFEIEDESI